MTLPPDGIIQRPQSSRLTRRMRLARTPELPRLLPSGPTAGCLSVNLLGLWRHNLTL
jgi:hypothetical protein